METPLPRTVGELRDGYQQDLAFWSTDLSSCIEATIESPIEELLVWAMVWQSFGGRFMVIESRPSQLPGIDPDSKGASLYEHTWDALWRRDIHLQPLVRVGDTRYRLDIGMDYQSVTWSRAHVFVAIECDGHDFHEKTKEQAERDKRRDRDLQSIGWVIARFTGSEIVRDPIEVARQADALARGILRQRENAEEAMAREIEAKRGGR